MHHLSFVKYYKCSSYLKAQSGVFGLIIELTVNLLITYFALSKYFNNKSILGHEHTFIPQTLVMKEIIVTQSSSCNIIKTVNLEIFLPSIFDMSISRVVFS